MVLWHRHQSWDKLTLQDKVRDPRLQGLPFAIKQKHIVVTASYPARKRGVKKLQLWTEAKKVCPELITIVGEVGPL